MVLRSTLPLERCKKCGTREGLTRHHVFPRRYRETWTSRERGATVVLCRPCHDLVELLIAGAERLARGRLTQDLYTKIVAIFMRVELTSDRVRLVWRLMRKKLDRVVERALKRDSTVVRIYKRIVLWLETSLSLTIPVV